MIKLFPSVTNKLLIWGAAVALTALFLWPVLQHFTTHLPSRADGVFISWTIHWVADAILTGQNPHNAPIFRPYPNTLAYSDPYWSTAILSLPLLFFTHNLAILHNFHLLVGTVLLFVGCALLITAVTRSHWASLLTATLFTFSTFHLHYIVHLHTYLLAGFPWCLYGMIRWREDKQDRWLWLSGTAFVYQALNSPFSGFCLMAIIASVVLSDSHWQHLIWKQRKTVLLVGTVVLGIAFLTYVPAFIVSHSFHYTRSIREAANFGKSLNDLVTGETLGVLLILGSLWRQQKKDSTTTKKLPLSLVSSLVITGVGLILSLGPVLKWDGATVKFGEIFIPLPYAVLYYVIPGFKAFRTSSRWIVVAVFGWSLMVGLLASKLRLKSFEKVVFLGVVIVSLWWLNRSTFSMHPLPRIVPPIYELVRIQPPGTVAEFPVYTWNMPPYSLAETDRLLWQTHHHHSLYNGASGFTPPEREERWQTLSQKLAASDSIAHLKENNVRYLLVHFAEYDRLHIHRFAPGNHAYPAAFQLKKALSTDMGLVLIGCEENDCLYSLTSSEATSDSVYKP